MMNNGLSSRLTDTLKEEWILASGKYNAVCTRKDSFRSREREMCEFHRSGTGILYFLLSSLVFLRAVVRSSININIWFTVVIGKSYRSN